MQQRGILNNEIKAISEKFLGRKISQTELRLYPYLDYQMKNDKKIEPKRINADERLILATLRNEGHISGGASGLQMTKEFYDYIQQVLWFGYVI